MLASQFDTSYLPPSQTTNFLNPCGEDGLEECVSMEKWRGEKKIFERSLSCDIDYKKPSQYVTPCERVQKKPHPFRSPITFLRSSTLPRSNKKYCTFNRSPDYQTRLKTLTVSPNTSGWDVTTDQTYPETTTDNTPFRKVSSRPYYSKRQTLSEKPSKTKIMEELDKFEIRHRKVSLSRSEGGVTKLRRAGSFNNIIFGLKEEVMKADRRRRATVRTKKKASDSPGVIDVCLTLTSLNIIAPDVRRAGSVKHKLGSRSKDGYAQLDENFSSAKAYQKGSADNINHEFDYNLRRRASSLDFLPEAISKSSQNGSSTKSSPFARTTSMSQRSPFRKKMADGEVTLTGIKDLRGKGAKRPKSGIDSLFDAIERQEVDEVRKLLHILDVNINELNPDQFSPLDVALMCSETEIASVLLNHGAKENPAFDDPEERLKHLETLIENADKNVNDFSATIVNSIGDVKDNERQLREWEWRLYMLTIMRNGFLNTECPREAPLVVVAPLSNESIIVTLGTASEGCEGMITRYKVEWSRHPDFSEIEGEENLTDRRQLNFTITALEKNIPWYIRVQSGNMKGFSPYGFPMPAAVIPSSWHECDESLPRYYGASDRFGEIIEELYDFQKQTLEKNSDDNSDEESTSPQALPRSPKLKHKKVKIRTISRYTSMIFNSAPKLLKKIKGRGIYLAALLYNDDLTRVLVTMDDNLPVVECDENYSKSFSQEFYWFSKASCTWEDIQHMLFFSTKSHSSQSVQIRRKLLQSALALMNATGVTDLGPIHYKPFKDNHGSILLLAVNCVKKLPSSRAMTMKWMPIQKLVKKTSAFNEQVIVPERLFPSVQEQVTSHRRSRMHLPKGLYLGYLKLRTSVDTLSLIVPNSHTNVLPYVKIQDVPNVTREEWEWLKTLKFENEQPGEESFPPASVQMFEKRLRNSISKLFAQLSLPTETILTHRLYDHEVIEMNSQVLFILICPPVEDMCTPPHQTDDFTNLTAFAAIPVQAFEMANMMTYQPKLMSSYCRLSSILELENLSTQQTLRETISFNENKYFKDKQVRIHEFQQMVDDIWRSSRWIVDTLQSCQDKNLNIGIPLYALYKTKDWDSLTYKGSLSSVNGTLDVSTDISDETNTVLPPCPQSSDDDTDAVVVTERVVMIHGTSDVGLSDEDFTEVKITETTTARQVIDMACRQLLELCANPTEGANDDVISNNGHEKLALVVVSGSRERCLRDDLNIMQLQNPWENGTLYLRLKKEALRATKWGLSTAV